MKYPKKFREGLVRRILHDKVSVKDLSKKHNIQSHNALHMASGCERWPHVWRQRQESVAEYVTFPKDQYHGFEPGFTLGGPILRDKLSLLLEAKGKAEKSLGVWLREKGLHSDKLKVWEEEIRSALEGAEDTSREKELELELKQVRRDLVRKEKALAEMTALVVLKKKALRLFGEEELP